MSLKETTDKLELISCIDKVRKSDFVKLNPVVDIVLNNPLVDEYFKRNLNENTIADSSFEKKIAVTIAKIASQYLGFDREKSKQAALTTVDFLREIRRVYLLDKQRISEAEYNQHKELTWWAKIKGVAKAAWQIGKESIKRFVREKGLSWLLKKAVKYVPNPVITVATKVWDVIPAPIKTVVKTKIHKLADKAVESIPYVIEKVKENAPKIVKKVQRYVAKGIEKAKEIGREIADWGQSIAETAKNLMRGFAKEKAKEGNLLSNILSWVGL